MRAMRIALISVVVAAGCGGIAMAQVENYTPTVDEEGGVPTRCTLEYVAMIGQDRRKNDLAFKITAFTEARPSSPSMVYFTIGGQRLARSVENLEITQASVVAGTVKMNGNVSKPSDTGAYSMGSSGEELLTLPLAMAGGSTITFSVEDDSTPVTLNLPAASPATRQTLFSCFQRATALPEAVRPEIPGAQPTTPAQ